MRIKILIIVCLLAFDAFGFYTGLHPSVSDAYRGFYLTHTLTVDEYYQAVKAGHP
ncbi:hypothetical protein ACI01nite_03280 [Acetobacter cibinongensis]|uniref:Uncharacterized protein n=1 Tax=Acetobacter cibinongensis TaxID=146475 RepID=A0A0D6N6S3_9PROT|nr:hypothetical protein [Acetobacter cibinongensis]GAN61380.1 hypothetical protein Abci_018_250 [Acetobacter cibinongensis]GEL57726.1 hypothetical protein ACI01nite_03280 [Acetobacter cibinongensis]